MEALIAELLKNFGPTGVVAAIGIYALRAIMPLAVAAVGHLGRIADAVQQQSLQLTALDVKIDRIADEVGENAQDLAGLYGAMGKTRPSRSSAGTATTVLKGATGD